MTKIPFQNRSLQIPDSLDVDDNLQLSHDDLIGLIQQKIILKKLSKSEKLKSVKEFPSTGILALLSWKVYESLEKVVLPDQWTLLTVGFNKDLSNGYYGAAFINLEDNRVIVAHRGTEVNNVGALVVDIAGIVFNNCGGQMSAACTFANKIVQALKAVEEKEDIHFELFFTGHSLGGWLAQVTTFTTAFLKINGKSFTKLTSQDAEPFHPQTTVFESPGCLPMLLKLQQKFETEDCEHIDLHSLSITSYLSAPNLINTCNEHYGKVYRIFDDSTKMNFLDRNIAYTLNTHSIERIVNFFQQTQKRLHEVIEWPTREGLTGYQELEKFLKYADHRNRFHIRGVVQEATEKIRIRYKTKQYETCVYPVTIFSKREKQFLEVIYWLKQLYEPSAIKAVFHELIDMNSDEIVEIISSFDIIGQSVLLANSEKIQFFPTIKLLLKLFPRIREKAQSFFNDPENRAKVFAYETSRCLKSFSQDVLDFKIDAIDFDRIFDKEKKFVHVKVKQGCSSNGVLMIHKALLSYNSKNLHLVLDLERFFIINELLDLQEFASSDEDFFLIIYCEDVGQLTESQVRSFKSISETFHSFERLRTVFIGENKRVVEEAKSKLENRFYEVEISASWDDLTLESQTEVLNREVIFQGLPVKFSSLFKSSLETDTKQGLALNEHAFLQLMKEKKVEINSDPCSSCEFSVFTVDHGKKEIKAEKVFESLEATRDVFVISGIYDDCLESVLKTFADVFKDINDDQQKLIDANLAFDNDIVSSKNRKLLVISTMGSKNSLEEFNKICRLASFDARTFHWIKIEDGKLFWRKTSRQSNFIERNLLIESRNCSYDDLLNEKVIAVVGTPGEGKSAFLARLAIESVARSWIIFFNINDVTVKNLKADDLNMESLFSFLSETSRYETENCCEEFLLRQKLSTESQMPIHIFIDGLDEATNEKDRCKAIALIKFINEHTSCRVIFSSTDSLANDVQAKICKLGRFDRTMHENLLMNAWKIRFSLSWGSKYCEEIFNDDENSKFKIFAKVLLDQLENNLTEENFSMGVPKQLKLLAELFQEDFENFVQLGNVKQKIGLNLISFHQHYIKTKLKLYMTAQSYYVDSFVPQEVKNMMKK